MKRIGGNRRKSRYKMRVSLSDKGKLHIKRYMQKYEMGDKVLLKAYPAYHKGLFCLRFYGKIGEIVGEQGDCYKVSVKDGGKLKTCIIHPVHLLRA